MSDTRKCERKSCERPIGARRVEISWPALDGFRPLLAGSADFHKECAPLIQQCPCIDCSREHAAYTMRFRGIAPSFSMVVDGRVIYL